jgi:hypothetical protein
MRWTNFQRAGRAMAAAVVVGLGLGGCGGSAEEQPEAVAAAEEEDGLARASATAEVVICVSCGAQIEQQINRQNQIAVAMRQAQAEAIARAQREAAAARQRALQNEFRCRETRDKAVADANQAFEGGMRGTLEAQGRCIARSQLTPACMSGTAAQRTNACYQGAAANIEVERVSCVGTPPPPPHSAATVAAINEVLARCGSRAQEQTRTRRSWCDGGQNFGSAGSLNKACVREQEWGCLAIGSRAEFAVQKQKTDALGKAGSQYASCVNGQV